MKSFEAIEFQSSPGYSPPTGSFVRRWRYGNRVWTREGERGAPGRLTCAVFGSEREASLDYEQAGYDTVRRGGFSDAYDYGECSYHGYLANPEGHFLDAWAATVRADVHLEGHSRIHWVHVDGLLTEREFNQGAAALADYLTAGPHAIDASTDRIVAQTCRLPMVRTALAGERDGLIDYIGFNTTSAKLCPVTSGCIHGPISCDPCTNFTAELLLFLTQGHCITDMPWDNRTLIGDTARRLVAAGIRT